LRAYNALRPSQQKKVDELADILVEKVRLRTGKVLSPFGSREAALKVIGKLFNWIYRQGGIGGVTLESRSIDRHFCGHIIKRDLRSWTACYLAEAWARISCSFCFLSAANGLGS
jgi:hypothetical protein